MTQYDDNNKGVLFFNKDKKTDKHPTRKGSINIEGVEYWLSAWDNTSKNGAPYMSLSVSKKEAVAEPVDNNELDDMDSIPF